MGILRVKTSWIFPGQGSQHIGMGKDLYESSKTAKKLYKLAEEILEFDFKSVVFEGLNDQLNQTKYTQPSIFVTSVVLGKMLLKRRLEPFTVAGHSLGEYSALTIADSISFEKGLELVKTRADSMDKAGKLGNGTMAAIIGLEAKEVQKICLSYAGEGLVVIANYNSPKQIVISGTHDAVLNIIDIAKDKGAKLAVELKVSGAFHSPLMKPARETLTKALSLIKIKDPKYPFFNNVDGKLQIRGENIKASLIEQLEKPVLWTKSIIEMKNYGAQSFLEVGPGKVLQGLNKRIDRSLNSSGVDSLEQIQTLYV